MIMSLLTMQQVKCHLDTQGSQCGLGVVPSAPGKTSGLTVVGQSTPTPSPPHPPATGSALACLQGSVQLSNSKMAFIK